MKIKSMKSISWISFFCLGIGGLLLSSPALAFVPHLGSIESQWVAGSSLFGLSLGAAGQPQASAFENENYFVRKQKLQENDQKQIPREKLPFIWDLGYAYRRIHDQDAGKTLFLTDQAHFYTGALEWVKEPGFQMRARVTVNELPEEKLGQGGLFFTPGYAFAKHRLKLFYEFGFLRSVKTPADSPRTAASGSVSGTLDFYDYSQGPELQWIPQPGLKLIFLARFHRYGFRQRELFQTLDLPFSAHDGGYATDSYLGLAERLLTYPSFNLEASGLWSVSPIWEIFLQLNWNTFTEGGEDRGPLIGSSIRVTRTISPKWLLGAAVGGVVGPGQNKLLGSLNGSFLF